MTDEFVPGSVALDEPTPTENAIDIRVAADPDDVPDFVEPDPDPPVAASSVEDVLSPGEELIGERYDDNEGLLFVVTSHGRKIAFDGESATVLSGPPVGLNE